MLPVFTIYLIFNREKYLFGKLIMRFIPILMKNLKLHVLEVSDVSKSKYFCNCFFFPWNFLKE